MGRRGKTVKSIEVAGSEGKTWAHCLHGVGGKQACHHENPFVIGSPKFIEWRKARRYLSRNAIGMGMAHVSVQQQGAEPGNNDTKSRAAARE